MRISDWSSDGCSSDLAEFGRQPRRRAEGIEELDHGTGIGFRPFALRVHFSNDRIGTQRLAQFVGEEDHAAILPSARACWASRWRASSQSAALVAALAARKIERLSSGSEEHTSELQSLMRTSYAVFCLKK